MISDLQSEIDHIDYTPDGKVHRIYKTSGGVILFVYDAKGDRVCKVSSEGYYYYFRDANGEILEVIKFNPPSDPGNLWEQILVDLETSGVGTSEVSKKTKQSKQNTALSGGPLSCDGVTWNSTFDSTNNYWNCWSSYDLNIVDPLNNPFLLVGEPDFANMYGFGHNEWFIYGAAGHGRFATYKANQALGDAGGYSNGIDSAAKTDFARYMNMKRYELKDHLGNVRVVVGDMKLPTNAALTSFVANVYAVNTYFPYGSLQPMRWAELDEYNFGYNGMLKDDDIMATSTGRSGEGNLYSTLYRGYNSRFGRWFSLDPLAAEFAWSSPYVGMGANPINRKDPNGDADFGVKVGFSLSLDSPINYSLNASTGISERYAYVMPSFNVAYNIYNGGLGTTQGATGELSWKGDLVLSTSFTVGAGKVTKSMPLNTFNAMTKSSTSNSFKYSGTFAMNWVFNNEGRNQRVGSYGIKANNFSLHIYNDNRRFLGDKNDRWWTGGGALSVLTNNGFAKFSTEVFTGEFLGRHEYTQGNIRGSKTGTYRMKSTYDLLLNNAQTSLSFGHGNISVGASRLGPLQSWTQDWIHNLKEDGLFDFSNSNDAFNIIGTGALQDEVD